MLLRCLDGEGKPVARSYTPVSSDDDLGYFDLLVKLYPLGKMSQHLQALQIGQSIEVRGPQGSLEYKGQGQFKILRRLAPPQSGTEFRISHVKQVGMIAGGSGITPMLQLLRDVSKRGEADTTKLSLLFANVTEADILLRSELEELRENRSSTNIHYTLDRPAESWTGLKGFVTPDMIKAHLPAPSAATLILLCGPKPMVDLMEKHLQGMGYTDDMIFKY
jgi:cytochrome-b5 reductase